MALVCCSVLRPLCSQSAHMFDGGQMDYNLENENERGVEILFYS